MARIVRLTESDLTRIVKRVLNEQPNLNKEFKKGFTFNIYTDYENKNPWRDTNGTPVQYKVTIDPGPGMSFEKGQAAYDTVFAATRGEGFQSDMFGYRCEDAGFNNVPTNRKFYNKFVEASLQKKYCSTNASGRPIKKADAPR